MYSYSLGLYEKAFPKETPLEEKLAAAKECSGKPTAIIAKSIKGKGVSFMEDNVKWHGSAPNAEQYEQAVADIRATVADL